MLGLNIPQIMLFSRPISILAKELSPIKDEVKTIKNEYVGFALLAISGFYFIYYIKNRRKKWEISSESVLDSNIAHVKFKWTIKNFSYRERIEETLSDTFSDGYNVWQLLLNQSLYVYLILVDSNLPETHAKFRWNSESTCLWNTCIRTFDSQVEKFKVSEREHGSQLRLPSDYLRQNKDTLVIHWEIYSLIFSNSTPLDENLEYEIMFINLERIYLEKKFCDISLVVEDSPSRKKEFHVHKIIMSSVSKVFEAMFESQMMEAIEGRVIIEDIDSATFEEMLHFIYTGQADFERHSRGLMYAADKYEIHTLKNDVVDYLIRNLSVENSAETLALADQHSSPKLKNETIMFIEANKSDVLKTIGWKQLITSCPQAGYDLYTYSHQKASFFSS